MKIIRFLFSVPFALILLVLVIAAGTLYSVRDAYSQKGTEQLLSSVSWAQLELPFEDGTATLCHITNDAIAPYGRPALSDEQFNEIIRTSAADQLVTDFAQDLCGWFFDSEERPVIDTDRISDVVVKAAGAILFGTEKAEIRLPSQSAGVSLLSSAQSPSQDIDDLINSGKLPPDYAEILKEFAEENPHADIADLAEKLEDGELDADEIADLFPEGVDPEELVNDLMNEQGSDGNDDASEAISGSGEMLELLESIITEQLSTAIAESPDIKEAIDEFNRALDEIEPYRIAVSSLALYLLFGIIGIAALIIIAINGKGSTLGFPHIGFAAALDGFLFLAMSKALNYIPNGVFTEFHIPERTVRLLCDPLFTSFGKTGITLLASGALLFVFGIALGILRRKKDEPAEDIPQKSENSIDKDRQEVL